MILTPGHTPGSICIFLNNILFTGDAMLKYNKTVTKLPGGNEEESALSIKKLINEFDMSVKIYPGHGSSFLLSDYNNIE